MSDLSGKTVVIVGGAGLLGSAISGACAKAAAKVVIADIDEKKGAAFAKEIGASFEKVDISDPASLVSLAKKVGAVDGVVNAAYPKTVGFGASFFDREVKDMLADLDLHFGGCLSIIKAFSTHIQKQKSGSIILFGSIYGVTAPRFDIYEGTKMGVPPEYAAAKAGTIALAKYFASLLGKDGIRVNAISPGGITDKQPENFVKNYSKHLKIGQGLLAPEDVVGAVVFLLSDASKQMTGQNLVIDGGWTL